MNNKLVLHPSSAARSAARNLRVEANAAISNSTLTLEYRIQKPEGAPNINWPATDGRIVLLGNEARKDELWKTTCLEGFLLFADASYIELNFSPDGFWNAYHFDSYRTGMKPESRITEVCDFRALRAGDRCELSVLLDLAQAVKTPQHFRLGLTCVIETEGGERSYWSLKHSGEKPDFHDSRGHVLEMRI